MLTCIAFKPFTVVRVSLIFSHWYLKSVSLVSSVNSNVVILAASGYNVFVAQQQLRVKCFHFGASVNFCLGG